MPFRECEISDMPCRRAKAWQAFLMLASWGGFLETQQRKAGEEAERRKLIPGCKQGCLKKTKFFQTMLGAWALIIQVSEK